MKIYVKIKKLYRKKYLTLPQYHRIYIYYFVYINNQKVF